MAASLTTPEYAFALRSAVPHRAASDSRHISDREFGAILNEPAIGGVQVSLGSRYSAVPAQLMDDPRVPGGDAIRPTVDQEYPLIQNF